MDPIQIESPAAQINRARFAGKDFFTFVDDIVARIQTLFVTEFNDFVVSGTGQMLIDIVSWAAETLSFYIDRQASESYLLTARTRKAVNRLCRQIGYKMAGGIAASVDLEVNLQQIYAFNVTIPVGFQFQGPSDLVFEATEAVTFLAGEGPLSPSRTVACREGMTRTETFTSNGAKNQVFRLNPGDGKFVAEGTVSVIVAGVPWDITDLITFDQTNQVEVDFNSDPTTVRFGDGVAGNVPATGASIVVVYTATSGKSGLVLNSTIDDVVAPLVVMFQSIPLTITNPEPSSGGADPEDTTTAKANAPRFFKARNVAVTQEDYVGLSQTYSDPLAGSVAVAQAFVARGADDDLALQALLNNIRGLVQPVADDVTALANSAEANRVAIDGARGDISTAVTTDIQASLDAIVTAPQTPSASGDAIDARTAAQSIRVIANNASVRADEGIAAGTLGLKDVAFNDIKTQLSNVEAQVQAIVTSAGNIEQSVADANVAVVDATNALSVQSTELASQQTTIAAIITRVTTQFENLVEDELQAIFDHVDAFLAADCQANLVQVPILTRDVDGFLAEPPIALMRSLEAYLEERKEVTQVVEVVSGGPYLVAADITGTIGIRDGYVQATVLSNVRKALDDLLRVRPFGKSLRLSDLYASIVPDPSTGQKGVDGIMYAIFRITGPALLIDGDGNLVIEAKQVVTKGTVTLTGQVAAA
jgi:hypothetical protein